MSSILEALERAEKERTPDEKRNFLDPDAFGSGFWQRRGLLVFVGLVVLINLLIWLWVINADGPPAQDETATTRTTPPQQEQLTTTDQVLSILEQSKPGAERESAPPLLAEVRIPEPVKPRSPTPIQTAPEPLTATLESQQSKDVAQEQAVQTAAEAVPEPPGNQAESAVQVTAPATVEETVDTSDSGPEQIAEQPLTDQTKPLSEQEENERIPVLWELPANLQEKLSGLKINIHVFNDEPSQRFVIIDMQKYKEGDQLETYGMRLERITREGIIINHGKGRVRM